ncbi:MAG: oxidoreductase, partial [Spirochaetales bacterium]
MNPIVLGPLVAASLSAFLALVIALVDKVVNDYGEVTLDVNGGKRSFKV